MQYADPAQNYSQEPLDEAVADIIKDRGLVQKWVGELEQAMVSEDEKRRKLTEVQRILKTLKHCLPISLFSVEYLIGAGGVSQCCATRKGGRMNCPACGNKIKMGDTHCPHCGKEIPSVFIADYLENEVAKYRHWHNVGWIITGFGIGFIIIGWIIATVAPASNIGGFLNAGVVFILVGMALSFSYNRRTKAVLKTLKTLMGDTKRK